MQFTLFSELFSKIDTLTTSFVTDVSSNAITAIWPIASAGLTLSFVVYGLLIIQGVIDMPLLDFVSKSVKIAVVLSIAMAGGIYQTDIAEMIQKTPDALATSLLSNHEQKTSAEVIDAAADMGFNAAADAFNKSSFFSKVGLTYAVFGVFFIITTAIVTAIGAIFIVLAKVALALLAALGPLFIVALLFKSTARLFEAWLSQVLGYGLLVVLLAAVFGFMLHLFTGYVDAIHLDGNVEVAKALGGCVILSLATAVLIWRLPQMAASLSQGVAIELSEGVRNTRAIGKGVANGAGSAARALKNYTTRKLGHRD